MPAFEVPALIDEVPILALLASAAQGETVFEGVGELRVKESNRLDAIVAGLTLLGIEAFTRGDDLHIIGNPAWLRDDRGSEPIVMAVHHDHRLSMTWQIADLIAAAHITVDDRQCASVSWPGFAGDVESLSSSS